VSAMGVKVGGEDPVVFYSPSTDVVLWKPIRL
jgi:hypothetical protein